jgi:hypothetical protein
MTQECRTAYESYFQRKPARTIFNPLDRIDIRALPHSAEFLNSSNVAMKLRIEEPFHLRNVDLLRACQLDSGQLLDEANQTAHFFVYEVLYKSTFLDFLQLEGLRLFLPEALQVTFCTR